MRKVVISVRITPAEDRLLHQLAKIRDVSISRLIRETIQALLMAEKKP